MYQDHEKTFITSLEKFKTALREHTEEYLHKTFRWKKVETWIDQILARNIEDIVMAALGYENDSFHRGWKLRQHASDSSAIVAIIQDLARSQAQVALPAFIEAKRNAINKKISSAKFKKEIVDMYQYELNSAIRAQMREWVAQNATPVVEELFNRHTDDYSKSIKLKCRLTMDSLLLLADGPHASDDG